jgi:hypothetical protein
MTCGGEMPAEQRRARTECRDVCVARGVRVVAAGAQKSEC